jgi:4-hydroxy-tetrahydrodipicolinate synthase
MQAEFSGSWIPLVTPFRDGAVDHAALRRFTVHCVQAGVAGFVACGSTGEAAALDDGEQAAVLATVLAAAHGKPVLMGLAGNHLGRTRERLLRLADVREGAAQAAGFLVPAPYYVRPSQSGLLQWFGTLADASPQPLVVYDIPYRTGVEMALPTLLALAAHPRVRAVKDCAGAPDKTRALIADGRLAVLAGNDGEIFSTLCLGGAGAVAASAMLHPAAWVGLHRALAAQHLHQARAAWQQLAPLIALMFSEPNPAPLKAWLAHTGWMADELRAPMTRCSAPLRAQLIAAAGVLAGPAAA